MVELGSQYLTLVGRVRFAFLVVSQLIHLLSFSRSMTLIQIVGVKCRIESVIELFMNAQ
jgi:hypothetical protein